MASRATTAAEAGGTCDFDSTTYEVGLQRFRWHQVWIEGMAVSVTADLTGVPVGGTGSDTLATGLTNGEPVVIDNFEYESFTLTPSGSGSAVGHIRSRDPQPSV